MERGDALEQLERMALALTLLGAPRAEVAAWQEAAAAVTSMAEDAWESWRAGAVGPDLPAAIGEPLRRWAASGAPAELEALLMQVPPGLFDLLALPGLDPDRVRTLWSPGDILTLRQLERACRRGRVATLPGFDPRLEADLLAAIDTRRHGQGRWLRRSALDQAATREAHLARTKGVLRWEQAGRLRRAWEVVEELVWVVAADDPAQVLGRLATLEEAGYPDPQSADTLCLAARHAARERIVVVEERAFAARLFLETGSARHVRDCLRRIVAGAADEWPASEEEIYARAGLAWIPPELREGRGEIEAAAAGALPTLITTADLRGALHVHTDWSDGRSPLRDVVAEARALGWSFVGIADHSQSAFYARGLTPDRLLAQAEEVARVRAEFPDLHIFHGVECDILPGGRLDLPDQSLARLDYVLVSIHTTLGEDRAAMTRRVIAAVETAPTSILAHPSGRLLLEREGYALDWEAVFSALARTGVAIEFNARPERLDLDWRLLRAATARGIPVCINPDAHSARGLRMAQDGVATARKGWLTAAQTLNCLPPAVLAQRLRARRA